MKQMKCDTNILYTDLFSSKTTKGYQTSCLWSRKEDFNTKLSFGVYQTS